MKIIFYPYDFEYKIENHKIFVYSYSKLDDGSKVIIKHEHKVFFYASLENINVKEFKNRLSNLFVERKPEFAKVLGYEEITKEFLGKNKLFLKIFVNFPAAVPLIAKKIQEWGIECFEKDILFIHRYLRDLNITPMTQIEADGEYINNVFLANTLIQRKSETRKDWKILALDIETYAKSKEINMQKNPILMVALYGDLSGVKDNELIGEISGISSKSFKKVITWKQFSTDDETIEFVENEKELILRTAELIKHFSPEILTGYFSDGFDLPYLQARADIHKIKFDIGKLNVRNQARTTQVKINGLLHLDMLKFIKQIFGLDLKVENYSLDTIAEKLLGARKHEVNLDQLGVAWDNGNETELEKFCQYNLQDSKLTFALCSKLLFDMIEFSIITGLPTFDVTRMRFGRLVESYIMKKAILQNVVAPNRPGDDEIGERMDESIKGGFVYEPIPGLYRDIAVFDFRSLYPTIIISHNIGPEGFQCSCCTDTKVPTKQEYWFCKKQNFLPSVLREIIDRRTEVKSQIKLIDDNHEKTRLEAKSYALKILANSFYGYLGYYGARWYSLESAASTTAYARHYIKDTINKAEKKGFQVCYADTDSCFLLLGKKKLDDALEFMHGINSLLPGNMELEFEGYFVRGIFVGVKGSGKISGLTIGAKKKYALLKDDGSIKITGFETVRRNWSLLAKEVQRDVLKFVLEDKVDMAISYVKAVVKDLKQGNIQISKLLLKTQITRPLDKYKSIGPHIAVARRMVEKGETVGPGTLVKYVIVQGSGLVRDRAKLPSEVKEGEYDHDYYINHQLIPTISSIFTVFGYSEEVLFEESHQKGLGGFF